MDIRSPLPVSVGLTSPAAALEGVNVSPTVRNILAAIAQNTALSDNQKTNLVAATAAASQISNVNVAELTLKNVSSTGIYLRNTGGEGWPRWQVLTALRAYGLNLTEQKAALPALTDTQLVAQAQAKLEAAVREARSTAATQVAPQAVVQQVAVQAAPPPAPTLKTAPAAGKPAPLAPTPTSSVDTLV